MRDIEWSYEWQKTMTEGRAASRGASVGAYQKVWLQGGMMRGTIADVQV